MVEVAIADPLLDNHIIGYFYIFISETDVNGQQILKQDAGDARVSYNFKLTTIDPVTGSNNYFDVYKNVCDEPDGIHACSDSVMNPEDSWFRSSGYERHYSENW
jgi:hypothetical protein